MAGKRRSDKGMTTEGRQRPAENRDGDSAARLLGQIATLTTTSEQQGAELPKQAEEATQRRVGPDPSPDCHQVRLVVVER
jgi:hypothetical protein